MNKSLFAALKVQILPPSLSLSLPPSISVIHLSFKRPQCSPLCCSSRTCLFSESVLTKHGRWSASGALLRCRETDLACRETVNPGWSAAALWWLCRHAQLQPSTQQTGGSGTDAVRPCLKSSCSCQLCSATYVLFLLQWPLPEYQLLLQLLVLLLRLVWSCWLTSDPWILPYSQPKPHYVHIFTTGLEHIYLVRNHIFYTYSLGTNSLN